MTETNTKPKMDDHLLTTREVADYVGSTTRHIHNLVRRRLIPVIKVGRLTRFDPDQVKAALAKLTVVERD